MRTKGELKRLAAICKCIEIKQCPNKEEIRQFVMLHSFSGQKDGYICTSQIEKDIYTLRNEFDAPIKYSRERQGYYYTDFDYVFWRDLLVYFSSFVEFPKEITNILFSSK